MTSYHSRSDSSALMITLEHLSFKHGLMQEKDSSKDISRRGNLNVHLKEDVRWYEMVHRWHGNGEKMSQVTGY